MRPRAKVASASTISPWRSWTAEAAPETAAAPPALFVRRRLRTVVAGLVVETDVVVTAAAYWDASAEAEEPGWVVDREDAVVFAHKTLV